MDYSPPLDKGIKHEIDLKQRTENYNKDHKPKMRSTLDYIDTVMGKIPEMYEMAAKLCCNDIEELTNELYSID